MAWPASAETPIGSTTDLRPERFLGGHARVPIFEPIYPVGLHPKDEFGEPARIADENASRGGRAKGPRGRETQRVLVMTPNRRESWRPGQSCVCGAGPLCRTLNVLSVRTRSLRACAVKEWTLGGRTVQPYDRYASANSDFLLSRPWGVCRGRPTAAALPGE